MAGSGPESVIGCPECGAVLEGLVPESRYEDILEQLHKALGENKRLRGEQARAPERDPFYQTAMEVLEFWKTKLAPRTRGLGGKRLQCVLARLHENYTARQLQVCVIGYMNKPYVTSSGRSARGLPIQRHVDADLIFRDAKHVDAGIAFAEAEVGPDFGPDWIEDRARQVPREQAEYEQMEIVRILAGS